MTAGRLILLDAGPLGLVTNPKESDETRRCGEWLRSALAAGDRVMVPEIADYEVRRELTRVGKHKGIARLDDLTERLEYLPVTTEVWRRAAGLWAAARNQGQPTAKDAALDGDVILAATAQLAAEGEAGYEVVVATTNVGHLGRFVDARGWESIRTGAVAGSGDPGVTPFDAGAEADRLIAEVKTAKVGPSTQVWLLIGLVDESGRALGPLRKEVGPMVKVKGANHPGGLSFAKSLYVDSVCQNIGSLVRPAKAGFFEPPEYPGRRVRIVGFDLQIVPGD